MYLTSNAESEKVGQVKLMQHFIRRNQGYARVSQSQLPPRNMVLVDSEKLYPGVPHSWLCHGTLLRLIDPSHSGNYRLFQVCITCFCRDVLLFFFNDNLLFYIVPVLYVFFLSRINGDEGNQLLLAI